MRVVMTGATGFLGLHLLAELVDRGDQVTVLVRKAPERAIAQLRRGLCALGRSASDVENILGQLTACKVDLVADHLGLDFDEFQALADGADEVWHSAGQIALSGSAEKCAVNVEGTRRILELATWGRRQPTVHHISTAFVAGRMREGLVLETDLDLGFGFINHYERAKWLAEHLVRSWSAKVGRPAVIYRPSVLVSDKGVRSGLPIHPIGTMTMYFEELFGSRASELRQPSRLPIFGRFDNHLNLLQVEHAARAIVALSEAPVTHDGVTTFHVVHQQETPIRRIMEMLELVIPVVITMVEHEQEGWHPEDQPELGGFLPYFAYSRRYDSRNACRAGVLIDAPEITTEYLVRSVRWSLQGQSVTERCS